MVRAIENPAMLVRWALETAAEAPEARTAWMASALVDWATSDGEALLLEQVQPDSDISNDWDFLDELEPDLRERAETLRERLNTHNAQAIDQDQRMLFDEHLVEEANEAVDLVISGFWRSLFHDVAEDTTFAQALQLIQIREKALLLGDERVVAGSMGTSQIVSLAEELAWHSLDTDEARDNEARIMGHDPQDWPYDEPAVELASLRDGVGHSIAVVAWDKPYRLIREILAKDEAPLDTTYFNALYVMMSHIECKGVLNAEAMPEEWVTAHSVAEEDLPLEDDETEPVPEA